MPTTTYSVPDISCDHCVRALTDALRPVEGVEQVTVTIDTRTVEVAGTFDDATARAAIDEAGYAVA